MSRVHKARRVERERLAKLASVPSTTGTQPNVDGQHTASVSNTTAAPGSAAVSKDLLPLLMKGYELAASEIQAIENANDKLVTLGIGAVGAGVSYGLISGKNEIFFGLPILLNSIYIYAVLNHHNITFLGSYKRFLEERINELAGDRVLLWEQIVVARRRWHIINVPLIAAYVIILIWVNWLSAAIVFATYSWIAACALLALQSILVILLIPGMVHWSRASRRGYHLAHSVYRQRDA